MALAICHRFPISMTAGWRDGAASTFDEGDGDEIVDVDVDAAEVAGRGGENERSVDSRFLHWQHDDNVMDNLGGTTLT